MLLAVIRLFVCRVPDFNSALYFVVISVSNVKLINKYIYIYIYTHIHT